MVIPEVRQERLYQKIANLIIKLINDNIFPPGTFKSPLLWLERDQYNKNLSQRIFIHRKRDG